jgi:hypothetical protein
MAVLQSEIRTRDLPYTGKETATYYIQQINGYLKWTH